MKTTTFTAPNKRRAPRPFVFINMAMTADGKIATANRSVSSFGSKRDLEHLYKLRTSADAVMAGARTLDLNKVLLGTGGERFKKMRRRNGLGEYNLRVIVSGSGSIAPNAAIFHKRFSPILLLTTEHGSKSKLKQLRALADDVLVCGKTEIDFTRALHWLGEKWSVKRLLCEGGGELNSALFRAGLVDELHLTICPKIFGGRRAPTVADGDSIQRLNDTARFDLQSFRPAGDELFLIYRTKRH